MSDLVPLSIVAATQVIVASALGHALGELHQQRERLDAQAEAIRVLSQPLRLHLELPRQDGDAERPRHLRALALLLLAGPALWLWAHLRAHPHAVIGAAVGAAGAAAVGGLLLAPGRSAPVAPPQSLQAGGPSPVSSASSPPPPVSTGAPSAPVPTSAAPAPGVIVIAVPPPVGAAGSARPGSPWATATAVPTTASTSPSPSTRPPSPAPSPACLVSLSALGIVSACL